LHTLHCLQFLAPFARSCGTFVGQAPSVTTFTDEDIEQ
jgi:hypothetical protein